MKNKVLLGAGSLILLLTLMFVGCSTPLTMVEDTSLTIAHTNDTHGRILEGKYDGMGFAKISTKANELKMENANFLLLDAGDTLHGTTLVSLSQGEAAIRVLNAMGYDAMAPGNHDFNYGQDRLLELAAMADFPVVCANVVDSKGKTILDPYVILDVNGLKVGIFGLTTPETTYKTHPKNVEGLTFQDPVMVAEKMVKELSGKVHVIIALAHLGVDEETEVTSVDVMDQVEGIDLLIDGHSHTPMDEGTMAANGLVVQSGYHDKNLGVVSINYSMTEGTTAKAMLFTKAEAAEVADDESILALVETLSMENEAITEVVVSQTDVLLDGERDSVRTGSTNLGDMICSALIDVTGADFSLQNGGGIRASIEAGEVTKGDVITVLPFGNTVTVLEVSGETIKAIIENGVKSLPDSSGAYSHMGGLTFTVDQGKPAGSRVTEIMVGDSMIDPMAMYSLATNDFLAAGGDQYEMLMGKKVLGEFGTLDDILVAYMNK